MGYYEQWTITSGLLGGIPCFVMGFLGCQEKHYLLELKQNLLLVAKVGRGGQILWYTEVTFHFRRRGGRAGGRRRVGSPGGLAKGRTATVGLREKTKQKKQN